MAALEQTKRKKPAKYFAEKMGVSVRTVKRYIAQPRKIEFEIEKNESCGIQNKKKKKKKKNE